LCDVATSTSLARLLCDNWYVFSIPSGSRNPPSSVSRISEDAALYAASLYVFSRRFIVPFSFLSLSFCYSCPLSVRIHQEEEEEEEEEEKEEGVAMGK
jgi:hypothetical protein